MQGGEAFFPRSTVKVASKFGLANRNYGFDFTARKAEALNKRRPGTQDHGCRQRENPRSKNGRSRNSLFVLLMTVRTRRAKRQWFLDVQRVRVYV